MAYQSNPPGPIQLQQRPPTRIVASGTVSLAPGAVVQFAGSNNRQNRLYFSITNLDAALFLKVQTWNNVNFGTAFAQRPVGWETDADFQIYNPSNTNTVQFEVAEFYPDYGNLHGLPSRTTRTGGGGAPSGGGGTPGGGGTFGGGGTQAGGGTQPR